MEKIMGYGRKALFLVRVLSGYEERRIRFLRLQIQNRVEQALERRSVFRISKIQEQAISSEFSRLIRSMQDLNKSLEEIEIAIDQYFKPIDSNISVILSMQLKSQERNLKAIAGIAAQEHAACLQITTSETKKSASGCKDVAGVITSGQKQPD